MTVARRLPPILPPVLWIPAAVLFLLRPAAGLSEAQDIPSVGRPDQNFYGAVGQGVKVAWQLDRPGDPVEIPEDTEFVATLVITGVTNPAQVSRPDLKSLPEFWQRFVITEVPGSPSPAGTLSFGYRLRPRHRDVTELPALEFHYFNPAAAVGKQFKTAVARPVRLRVIPRPERSRPPPMPLTEPEELFAIATGPGVLTPPGFIPGPGAWLALAAAGPVAALGWYAAWRRIYPDGRRQALRRRSWAARRATRALRAARSAADPAGAVAAAVLDYLRHRFDLPAGAATPAEVAAVLTAQGLPAETVAAVADLLRSCDALRFGPDSDDGRPLAAAAEAVLAHLETT